MSSNDQTTQQATSAPAGEQEPLLGAPGTNTQKADQSVMRNLVTGTAPIAQLGAILLFGLVWTSIFTHPRILFSAHPLLNSAAILLALQAVLVLQPTHTPQQKKVGTYVHATFWVLANGAFYAALAVILVHKQRQGIGHFESPHAWMGVITYALLAAQAFVGFTQYFLPGLYGGVDNAKALYKYHRAFGYILITMMSVNVVLASLTYYAGAVLGLKTWTTSVATALIVLGLFPRIKKQKLGLQ